MLNTDNKSRFKIVNSLIKVTEVSIPDFQDVKHGCDSFARFFTEKIDKLLSSFINVIYNENEDISINNSSLEKFQTCTISDIEHLILQTKKTCVLDPIPNSIQEHCSVHLSPIITHIINLSLNESNVPTPLKKGIIRPLLKNQSLDKEVLSNYRPVSNLPQLSKLLEKVVARQLIKHTEGMSEVFQSAYKRHHSTETAHVNVCNDIKVAMERC